MWRQVQYCAKQPRGRSNCSITLRYNQCVPQRTWILEGMRLFSTILNSTSHIEWKGRKLEVKTLFFLCCPRVWWGDENCPVMTTRSFSLSWHWRFWSGRIWAAGPLRYQVSTTKECCFPRIPSQNWGEQHSAHGALERALFFWFLSTRALQWLLGSQFLWSTTKHLQVYSEQVILFTTKYTIC